MKYRDYLNLFLSSGEGSGGGGSSKPMRNVNFFDYDGTVVNSYSKEDFLALSAMPENPSHEGLVAQGWNWSFVNAQEYVQKYGVLNVGQMYTTDTGETRLYVTVDPATSDARRTFRVKFTSSVANNTTLNWGDGSDPETVGMTSIHEYTHTYANSGNYVIKLNVNTGTISFVGIAPIYGVMENFYNRARIRKIEIGDNIESFGTNAFQSCYLLESISIPSGVTEIGKSDFDNCCSLSYITIPNTVTSINENAFGHCNSLESISLPKSVTNIGVNAFVECYSLAHITIPNSVTNISNYAFSDCKVLTSIIIPNSVVSIGNTVFYRAYSLVKIIISNNITSIGAGAFSFCQAAEEYHFLSTAPPTLGTNAFSSIPSDCKIYVPIESVDTYKTASNWSTYASYIYGE